jgi:dedicator of cytokinesis protein 1
LHIRYHRVNNVQKFRFSRPAPRKDITLLNGDKEKETSNEFASLWLERTVLVTSHPLPGILRWFPVISSDTYLVSPLCNAIETMEATNTTLRDLIVSYR